MNNRRIMRTNFFDEAPVIPGDLLDVFNEVDEVSFPNIQVPDVASNETVVSKTFEPIEPDHTFQELRLEDPHGSSFSFEGDRGEEEDGRSEDDGGSEDNRGSDDDAERDDDETNDDGDERNDDDECNENNEDTSTCECKRKAMKSKRPELEQCLSCTKRVKKMRDHLSNAHHLNQEPRVKSSWERINLICAKNVVFNAKSVRSE